MALGRKKSTRQSEPARQGLPHVSFGAQSHSFSTRYLRFAVAVTRRPRKTRFRLPARLYRAGLATRRVPLRGFLFTSCQHSPLPELS